MTLKHTKQQYQPKRRPTRHPLSLSYVGSNYYNFVAGAWANAVTKNRLRGLHVTIALEIYVICK